MIEAYTKFKTVSKPNSNVLSPFTKVKRKYYVNHVC